MDDVELEERVPQQLPLHGNDSPPPRSARWRAALTAIWEVITTKGALILKVLSLTSLLITILALWQTILSSADAKRNTLLAEWSAKKEFLAFCEAHAWKDSDCQDARNVTLEPPPGLFPSVHRKRVAVILLLTSIRTKTTFVLDFMLLSFALCLTILGGVQVYLNYRDRRRNQFRVDQELTDSSLPLPSPMPHFPEQPLLDSESSISVTLPGTVLTPLLSNTSGVYRRRGWRDHEEPGLWNTNEPLMPPQITPEITPQITTQITPQITSPTPPRLSPITSVTNQHQ
ncbi:hypothetical protein QBC41DRAFT_20135 [Cercophora samala]|uniref:Uncharacterized protein n=1 Tax=Cercophora samala TaxID=330535 RepID=A0AA40DGF2_9PEZI|nr:hypothetical protein QBC41DRAFT_20135 [Cercophora samala]